MKDGDRIDLVVGTHWEGCERHHHECALAQLEIARAEVERLKAERWALVERAVRVGYAVGYDDGLNRYEGGPRHLNDIVARVLAEGEKP